MENFSGQVVKGYELRERIGAGGFGAVYRASQSTVGREVAIKIILPHFTNHPDFIRRFETEAHLIARLEHLHIIPLYDYWRDPDGAYLVMRWLRGGSMRDALQQNGRYDPESAALLLDQIASALASAHRSHVIHRDLKPANILLDEDGNAYLADFGIAKDLGKSGITELDMIVGSPDYIAPEQARSEQVTPQTDIYSLGVVLYEMLTGLHPFPNLSSVERMYRHLNDPLPAIPDLPDAINAVIQKATLKNPAHRYTDAIAMAVAFREAALPDQTPISLVESLTQREQEILLGIIAGKSNKEIASELFVTLATIKWYIKQIYAKLHVRSRVQAIVRARELNLIVGGDVKRDGDTISSQLIEPENPYKGLRAFQSADNREFFGRESLVEKLVKRLGEARFLAVVGPSGSGKSSLVKAGVIPALWRGELPGSDRWYMVEMLPGSHPLDELEVALLRVAANQSGNLKEQLERDERGLLRVAQLILPDDGSQLVLVIDQFEEVFTLLEDESARQHFLNMLHAAATDPRSRVRLVITLRADFYDRPLHYPEFGELVRSRMETILPLSADGLERAIAKPAEQQGVRFEEGLVASIISEVNYQPGALPLLQYALTELFERRQGRLLTHEAYRDIGGTVGALAKRADEIFDGLDDAGKEVARQMFLRLVTLGEGVEDTRRRVAHSELMAIAADEDLMDDLIDTYAEYRLLSLDNDPGTRSPTVEVAHEAILREWERLRTWLNDSREDIRLQRQLANMAAEWRDAKQDASFLARGSRLEQFEKWMKSSQLALTPAERTYLDASIARREHDNEVEAQRTVREKRLEKRSQTFLRGLIAVLLLAALGAFGLTGVAVSQSNIAQSNFTRSEAQRLAAEARGVLLQDGSAEVAALLAIRSLNTQYTPQGDESLLAVALMNYPIQAFTGHSDRVKAVDISPDGRTILTGSGDSTVRLWDAETGQEIRQFTGDMQDINSVAFSPDGYSIIAGSRHDHTVRLWDAESGEELQRFDDGNSGSFALDGRHIFIYSEESTASAMIDLQTREVLHRISAPQAPRRPEQSGYSPDGTLFIDTPPEENVIHIRVVATGEEILSFPRPTIFINFAFSRDNHYFLVTNGDNNSLLVWDLEKRELLHTLGGHTEPIISAEFSPDNRLIASGGEDRTIRIWDMQTGQEIQRLTGHTQAVRKVTFSADGKFILSGSFDNRALLWALTPTSSLPRFNEANNDIVNTTLSPDRTMLAGSRTDGTAVVWNANTGALLQVVQANKEPVFNVDFAFDGKWLVTGSDTIRVWDLENAALLRELDLEMPPVDFDVSQDGNHVAVINDQVIAGPGKVTLYDLTTGEEVKNYSTPIGGNSVVFSPDGAHLLVQSSSDYSARIFDTKTGAELDNFEVVIRIRAGGSPSEFSRDSRLLLTGSIDGLSWLWDINTGEQLREFIGHRDTVGDGAFSRDGHFLATSSDDETVRIWEMETGREIRHIALPFVPYKSDFSADDRTLFVLGSDQKIHQIHVGVQATVDDLCSRLLRDFTTAERDQYEIMDSIPTCSEFA